MLGDIIYSQEEQNEDRNESRNGNEDENVREMKNENKVEKENRNEEEKEKKVKERERNADVVTRKSKRRGGVSRDRGTYQALIPILEEASRGNINYQISINNDNDNNNNDNNSNNNNLQTKNSEKSEKIDKINKNTSFHENTKSNKSTVEDRKIENEDEDKSKINFLGYNDMKNEIIDCKGLSASDMGLDRNENDKYS